MTRSDASADSGFTLDAAELAARKAAHLRRLHAGQIPVIRAAGFVILSAIAALQALRADGAFLQPALAVLVGVNLGYAVLAWIVLRVGHGRAGRLDLSLVLFHADLLVWLFNLYHVEPANLFFAYFLLVRVADQVGFGFRRALYFNHVVVVVYLVYSAWITAHDPARAPWIDRLGLAATMYLLGLYLATSGIVIERLRQRMGAAVRSGRALVESLAAKTRALEAQAVQLEQARIDAERANLAKSQFLAVIGHEIRTPMNAILGTTELLLGHGLAPEQRRLATIAYRSGTALLGLIDDLLDLSRIDARKLALRTASVDLRLLAAEAVDLLAIAARDKPVVLRWHADARVPERVVADPVRLRQVLVNLLHNAVKFTDRGNVTLDIIVVERIGNSVRLRVAVHDSGIGIAPDQLDAVFDAFTQVDSSSTRRHGGSGLGLAIVRQLVELLGGTVGVDSRPGEGSTFRVDLALPVADHATPAAAEPAPVSDAEPTPTARVLLAEDDPVNQLVIEGLLARLGSDVHVVADGAAAERAAARERFALILMDLHMPGTDGYEATRRIRVAERASGAYTPIIALTADALASDRDRCIAAGMDDYVTKPVSGAALAAVLARWAGRQTPSLTQW